MAKDAKKVTDDNIISQWSKNSASHDALWKVVVRIAEEYRLGFDDRDEVIFEENARDKHKTNVSNTVPIGLDATQLLADIKTDIKDSKFKIDSKELSFKIDPQIHVVNNNEIFQAVTQK